MNTKDVCELLAIASLGVALCVASFTLGAGITSGVLATSAAENAQAATVTITGAIMLWLAGCLLYALENR